MKRYELKFIKGGRAAFKISVVKDGAVDGDIVLFEKEDDKSEILVFNDEEKQIFYSIVMRPNKIIPRNNINGEPAEIFYSKETVEAAAINYWRNKGNAETNINHSEEVNAEGIFPFESWIVQDPETDKSKTIGLKVYAGDWVAGYKVDSKELWNDYIKTGKLDGLSIEAMNHKYELIPNIEMSKKEVKKTFLEKFTDLLKHGKEIGLDFEEHDEPKEKTPEELEAEAVLKAAEEDEAAAAKAKLAADEPPKEKQEEHLPLDGADHEGAEAHKKRIAELEAEVADLKAEKVKADTALETMQKQTAAAKKISNFPPAEKSVPYSEMSNYQKLKFNKENARF